jgi:hypothetical protein
VLVKLDLSAVRETKWRDFAIRFVLGGSITAAAGLIAKEFGPKVGGLFLAFPAIFPAAATLVQKNEVEKKQDLGLSGTQRGIDAAAAEAAGTAIGSIGLAAFAALFWVLISRLGGLAFFVSLMGWGAVAAAIWLARKKLNFSHQRHYLHQRH